MKDDNHCDIDNIDYQCRYCESPPDLGNTEPAVLFELLVKRSSYIFEENYLFLSKSSYGYLKNGDTAVSKEGEADDKISKRDLQIDRVEGDEETDSPGTCISHEYLAREEIEQ